MTYIYKRQALLMDIKQALVDPYQVHAKMTASIMGKEGSVGNKIALWGPYILFRIVNALKNVA
jgi:hypothetical protein